MKNDDKGFLKLKKKKKKKIYVSFHPIYIERSRIALNRRFDTCSNINFFPIQKFKLSSKIKLHWYE